MEWMELNTRKDELFKIVNLLLDFDEKSGRYLRYADRSSHWTRRAIAASEPENTRILIQDLGNFCYTITAQYQSTTGLVATTYVHEDGIRQERSQHAENHPVHKIVCVTDLFAQAEPLINRESLNPFTIKLISASGRVE